MQLFTNFFVSSFISDNGSLVLLLHNPKSEAAYLTGPGLDSTNKALCSDDNQTETNELDFDQVQQADQKNDHTIEETPIQTSQDNLAKSSDEDKTQDL